jgi:hypothetical protein
MLAVVATGCGKSNLPHGPSASVRAPGAHARPARAPKPAAPSVVAVPLKLTPARAAAFARAVNLTALDVPGSHRAPPTPSVETRQEESQQCGQGEARAVGGGRSARLERGSELEAESISSSVIVLASAAAAQTDLAYAESPAGLRCYTKLLSRKLARESTASVAIGRVLVQRLKLLGSASGIRITARISGVKSGLTLGLYVDAVAFQYGPAEVELYATSFVQPVPARTEQELLAVMRARARMSTL